MGLRRLAPLAAVGAVAVAAASVALRPSPADAVDPPVLAAARAKLAGTQRLYLWLQPEPVPPHDVGWLYVAIRADLPARRVAVQFQSGPNYVYQDGVLTLAAPGLGGPTQTPVRLEAFEPFFAWLLMELDTGFADATFVAEKPPYTDQVVRGPTGTGWGTWRVSFPVAWDDPFRIYLTLHDPAVAGGDPDCWVESVDIFPATGSEPSTLYLPLLPFEGGSMEGYGWKPWAVASLAFCQRTQWEPDWSESANGVPDPWSTRLYHGRGLASDEYGGLFPNPGTP